MYEVMLVRKDGNNSHFCFNYEWEIDNFISNIRHQYSKKQPKEKVQLTVTKVERKFVKLVNIGSE